MIYKEISMVKLRIISDTHFDTEINGLDYNKKGIRHSSFGHYFYKSLLQDFDGITLIAGDLASSVKNTNLFLEGFFKDKPVIFIQGNHSYYQKTTKSIYEITQELREAFPITHAFWKFLENEWIWIPGTNSQVAIIGSCFYTDYKYKTFTLESYNEYKKSWHNVLKAWRCIPINEEYIPTKRLTAKKILDENIILAEDGLNDFKWGKDENGISYNTDKKDYVETDPNKGIEQFEGTYNSENGDGRYVTINKDGSIIIGVNPEPDFFNDKEKVKYLGESKFSFMAGTEFEDNYIIEFSNYGNRLKLVYGWHDYPLYFVK